MPNNDQVWMKSTSGMVVPVDPADVDQATRLGYTPANAPPQPGSLAMTPAGPAPASSGSSGWSPAPLFHLSNYPQAWQNLKALFQQPPINLPSTSPEYAPQQGQAVLPGTRIPLQQGLTEASSLANAAAMLYSPAPGAVTRPMPGVQAVPESKYFVPPSSTVMVNGVPAQVPLETLPTGGTRALPAGVEMFRSGIPGLQSAGQSALGAAGTAARAPGTMTRELMGQGPSMQRLEVAKDMNALPLKQKIVTIANAARADAQAALNGAVEGMDRDNPNGLVARDEFGNAVNDIFNKYVQIPERMPEPIKTIVEGTEGSRLGQASVFRGAGTGMRAGKTGTRLVDISQFDLAANLPESVRKANPGIFGEQRLNDLLAQAGEQPIPDEGRLGWSAQQLQQLRVKLRNVARSNAPGPIRAAAREISDLTSDTLNNAAAKSPASQAAWATGNFKWARYAQSFEEKFERGTTQQSPLAKAMVGQNADEIMNPLTGSDAQLARELLRPYSRFGYNEPEFQQALSRHKTLSTISSISHPGKFDLAMALGPLLHPFTGGSLVSTYGVGRILGPALWRLYATRGIDPFTNVRGLPEVTPGMPQGPESPVYPPPPGMAPTPVYGPPPGMPPGPPAP